MRIVVATVHAPFVRGGAEAHARGLLDALQAAGHEAEIVSMPFKWYPPERIADQVLACRLLDLTESDGLAVDRLIGLKFPAYLIPHPSKVLWILHQHRPAYDLWDHPLGDLANYPNGAQVREVIRQADQQLIPEARAVFANSMNVARRLKHYCQIEATPLYHPPPCAEQFYCGEAEDYFFFPSRLTPNKRQHLVVEALARTRQSVRVCFASSTDHPSYTQELSQRIHELGLEHRAVLLGAVSDTEHRGLFAHARAVLYPPVDEDYGYVTLEAMLAAKPVITCTDSGGPLEFVRAGATGVIAEPTPEAVADAMDRLWEQRLSARAMGEAGRDLYASLRITWPAVVERLVSCA